MADRKGVPRRATVQAALTQAPWMTVVCICCRTSPAGTQTITMAADAYSHDYIQTGYRRSARFLGSALGPPCGV
eukprot:9502951-Pyramimonas_sp.AAC.1